MSDNHPRSEPDVVLSTVRRVVSGPAAEPDHASTTEAAPERLLLTPALRVSDDDLPDPPSAASLRRRARVQTRTLTAERLSLEQRIAELEQAVGDGEGWEPDGSEPADAETPSEFVFSGAHPSRTPNSLPEEPRATVTLVDENDLVQASAPQDQSHAPGPRSEPDEPGEQTDLTADPRPSPGQAVSSIRPIPAMADPAPSEPKLHQSAPDRAHKGESGIDIDEERLIDEEALRDIVAEIVRSELQGELGERITRNVRKLVRREIHRAIMTRDFG